MMLATRIIHIYWVFLYTTFQRMCMAKMDAFRSSTSRRLNSSMSPAFCSATASKTPVCYEHVPLVAAVEVFVALCFAPTK